MDDILPTDAGELDALADRIGRLVRAQRAARGMSLGDLARASGLSKTILARIERGAGNPSIETLWRLTRALRIPLGMLLTDDAAPRVRTIRHESGQELQVGSGMSAWLVHIAAHEHRSDFFELAVPGGLTSRSEPHVPGVEELIVCVAGRMRVGPAGEEAELDRGDAVWFAADAPHSYAALTDARALCWMLYPPGMAR
jgi:XRE family transcriptional regulator, regulator of sulfur utilization